MSFYEEVVDLVSEYHRWLADRTVLRQRGEIIEINTPFLDRHRDGIQIFAKKNGETIRLSDDGYTICDLEQSGLDLSTDRRKEILDTILRVNGVYKNGDELFVVATSESFSERKSDLLNAIMRVSDMYMMSTDKRQSTFQTEVRQWLGEKHIPGAADIRFMGVSGFSVMADFVITRDITRMPTVLQTVPKPDKQSMARILFSKNELVGQIAGICMMVNDRDVSSNMMGNIREFSKNNGISPLMWSSREKDLELIEAV